MGQRDDGRKRNGRREKAVSGFMVAHVFFWLISLLFQVYRGDGGGFYCQGSKGWHDCAFLFLSLYH